MDSGESPRYRRVHQNGHSGHPRAQSGLEPSAVGSRDPARLHGPLFRRCCCQDCQEVDLTEGEEEEIGNFDGKCAALCISNLRYQTLNAVEFLMAKAMPVGVFKATVVVLRCLNNVAGGMSFVLLGRLMGSQKVVEEEEAVKVE
ncbi:uncharacterized protein A4U43_UnF4080 [Asparagus officinalis]|uniref:Uncharacterized protein n=1 Tax=Asparagus officinalis TaxID=4686 RepID=A0A1R3L6Z2_ASPOF|nr:uncharacterized protein A4U43_UnF4080 [Asparagus officinalis]